MSPNSNIWDVFWMKQVQMGQNIVGMCAGHRSVSRPQEREMDTVKEYLRKRGLDVRKARRMVQDKCEWHGFVRGNAWGIARGTNP